MRRWRRLHDPTGLYYFNARYYDLALGGVITEDPARDGIWGLIGKDFVPAKNFKAGIRQLKRYTDFLPGVAFPGRSLPELMVIPFPVLGPRGKLYCYTYPIFVDGKSSAFGMIYYYAYDGNDGKQKEAEKTMPVVQSAPSSCASPDFSGVAVTGFIIGAGLIMGGSGYGGGGVPCHTY